MKNVYYVYRLRVDGETLPFYVGKGFDKRAYVHLGCYDDNRHKNNTIKKAIREGKQIHVEFIMTDLVEDDALMWEVFWIAEYGRKDLGYGPLTNKTDGGEGTSGHRHSEDSKAKMSEAKKGIPKSEEHKANISKSNKGVSKKKRSDKPRKPRKPMTQEHKDKLRAANLGRKRSEETRNRLSEAARAKWEERTQ